jgi:aminoglycoside phosphotransferase (APT) family kinase protein
MASARGELLAGGNMEPVVRVDDTVRRVAGPWTPAVHGLLRRYEGAGIGEAPRALGIDGHGREVLTFIPGEVMATLPPESLWSRELLRAAGTLLRQLHDVGEPLASAELTWRQPRREPAEVVCHNDFAPYNLIVDDGRLVGVIDFDMASPGSRLWDLAYLAYRLVPYAEDAEGFDADRDGKRTERLADLLAVYGIDRPHDDVRQVAALRLDALAEFTEDQAAATGRSDLAEHAAMYRRDADRLRR